MSRIFGKRDCDVCKDEFERVSPNHKYCSAECARAGARRNKEQRREQILEYQSKRYTKNRQQYLDLFRLRRRYLKEFDVPNIGWLPEDVYQEYRREAEKIKRGDHV